MTEEDARIADEKAELFGLSLSALVRMAIKALQPPKARQPRGGSLS